MTERSRQELKNPGYEIFVGILSILSIFNIILIYAVRDPNLDTVIDAMNWLLSIVFLADFTYRLGTGIIVVGVGIFGTFTGYLANPLPRPVEDP